ncbi:hypothetical protein ACWGKS_29260 [Nocardiopsis sp. NPDC055879]
MRRSRRMKRVERDSPL